MIMKTELTDLEKKGSFSFEQVDHPTCPGAVSWVFKCGGRTSVPFETLLAALEVFTRKVLEIEVKPLENHGKNLWFSRDPYGYTSAGKELPALQQEMREMGCKQISNPLGFIKTGIDYQIPAQVPTQVPEPAPAPVPTEEFTPPPVPEPESVPTSQPAGFSRILEIFGKAHHSIKYPKIDLMTADEQPIKLFLAGDKSSFPGSINVSNGGRYKEDGAVWYGRILPDGTWKPSRYCQDFVTEFLTQFNSNPSETARVHGHRHGWCCFCGKDLTTKESTTAGYGPVCADKYGLPWGHVEE